MVPEEGVEPTRSKAPADFESAASASSATPGLLAKLTRHASSLKHANGYLRAGQERSTIHSALALLGMRSGNRPIASESHRLPCVTTTVLLIFGIIFAIILRCGSPQGRWSAKVSFQAKECLRHC